MKTSTTTEQSYITRPQEGLAEGEIDLGQVRDSEEERIMSFIVELLQTALIRGSAEGQSAPSLSSLSVQRSGGALAGRIYGQAYTEKRGDTVAFLRIKLINEEGEVVMTGMATSHLAKQA